MFENGFFCVWWQGLVMIEVEIKQNDNNNNKRQKKLLELKSEET